MKTYSQVTSSDSLQKDYLNVYLDGANFYQEYIKQNVTFINYVRDRFDAQVHLIITQQQTGSGGTEFTLFYIGQQDFAGKNDTIRHIANSISTEDETRAGLVQKMKMGLLAFIAKLPNATAVEINFTQANEDAMDREEEDKWNNWVFSISGSGNASIENSYKYYYYGGNISANKVTDDWKINLNGGINSNNSKFIFGEEVGDTIISKNNSAYGNFTIVKSLGEHLSAGFDSYYNNSTYSNYDNNIIFAPAVEYDIFPYSESTSKLLSFFYRVRGQYSDYTDTTIYDKTSELLFSQAMDVSLSLTQKWGSVSTGVGGAHYFHDFSKNSLNFFGNLNWRIYEGLSIGGFFSYNIIHDQLNLPKSGASDEDILLQQKELAKSYSLYGFFRVTYSFGSIYNNVVNPRFETGSYSFYF
ncbi:MAG: hypothetical protein ACKVPJ_01830 [Chitinophagales bacterium]